jgi:hypothetical protein
MVTMEPQILILEDRDGGDWALCRVAYFDEVTKQRDEALRLLDELYALVNGECPSLLDEDRGGYADLDTRIARMLLLKGQSDGPA